MEISVIIPTYNRTNIVLKTIKNTLDNFNFFNDTFEIIVVNDGESEIIYKHNQVKIIKNKGKGVASARNYGFAHAKYDNLLFLDDDMLITKESITILHRFFLSNYAKTHCLNINWVYPPSLLQQCSYSNFGRFLLKINYVSLKGWMNKNEWKDNHQYEIEILTSQFLAITRENFNITDKYNETFPFCGFEDFEFAKRTRAKGIKTLLNTQTHIFHNEEDRVNIEGWLNRRYREGLTRALYVKLTADRNYQINHSYLKRTLYKTTYNFRNFFIFLIKLLNSKIFDIISFPLIKLLTGAYIWKGYSHEMRKKN